MMTALLWAALAAPAAEPEKGPAAKKELFAKEDWYTGEKGKEADFTGVLKYNPPAKGRVGFGRHNPFRLEMGGKAGVREVYVGGKDDLLKAYAGRRVKITGKPVDMEVEGRFHKEIWPARVELLPDEKPKADPKEAPASPVAPKEGEAKAPDIIARSPARIGVKGGEATQLVIRSAEDLAKAMGVEDMAKAAEMAAQQLKVKEIDFSKQMLIVVSAGTKRTGGYSVEVTGLEMKDKELVVKWKLNTPAPGRPVTQALTHPAQTILVEKFEGKVTFDPAPPKPDVKAPPIRRPVDGIRPPRIAPGTLPVVPEKEDPKKPVKIC